MGRKALAVLLMMMFVLAVAAGCGGKSTQTDKTDSAQEEKPASTEGKAYDLNEPVPFGGATFTFTDAEFVDSIPVMFEDENYTPGKGKYVVIHFTFSGEEGNEPGGVDLDIFRLKTSTDKEYLMDTDIINHEMSDLASSEKLALPSMLMWSNPEQKSSVLVFDVSSGAEGLKLNMIENAGGGKVETVATVDLGI